MHIKQLIVVTLFALSSSTANAQFGGGGGFGSGDEMTNQFGGKDFGFAGGFGPEGPSVIESGQLLVTISNSGKTVSAFSSKTGKVAKLSFDEKVEPFSPVVGHSVACFTFGETAYGFSVETGKWDSVNTGDKLFFPVVAGNMIGVSNGNSLFAFGGKRGKWLSIKTEGQLVPVMGNHSVKATDGGKIYICSENSTEWQVIDLENDD